MLWSHFIPDLTSRLGFHPATPLASLSQGKSILGVRVLHHTSQLQMHLPQTLLSGRSMPAQQRLFRIC